MNNTLLGLLRNGGYILYVRHGEATVGEDQPGFNFQDCYSQRYLSDLGRKQAVDYGEVLRLLRIPISYPVISSPFCRAIETAEFAFGRESVVVDPFWFDVYRLSGSLTSSEQNRILDVLKTKLEETPPPGKNTVIISHGFPSGVGLGQISDMGTVVIRPYGRGYGYKIISRMSLEDFRAALRQLELYNKF